MNSKTAGGGMGFSGWLTLAFIVLKLTGFIDWSWWWVLSPIWVVVLLIIVIALAVIVAKVWGETR